MTEAPVGPVGGEEVVVVPWPLLLRRRVARRIQSGDRFRWWVLWSVLAGLFSVYAVFTVVAVALPRMAAELHTTTSTVTWVVTGPLLLFGVAAPLLGKTGDLYGHRRMYLVGMVGAFFGAVATVLAPNVAVLIVVRLLTALAGGAVGAASMALIFTVFEPADRVKAMGFWSLVGAGAPVIGVAAGGPLVEAVGWRWVFAAQAPLIVVAGVLCLAVLPETPRATQQRLDWWGAALLTVSVTSLLLALNRGPVLGWSSPFVLGGLALAPLAAVAFVSVERRAAAPLIPLEYFRRRNFVFPVGAMACAQFAYMGGFILSPLLLGGPLFDYGESRIGAIVLSRPLSFSLVAPVAGYVAVRLGERSVAAVGTAAVVVSMFVFATVDAGEVTVVVAALVLSGLGNGIASPSLSSSIANTVSDEHLGVASAAGQLLTQVGVVAGIQLMQTVQASRMAEVGLRQSFADAYLVGGFVAVGAVACAMFVRSAERERDEGALPGALEPA